jgi:Tetratricopeptide repeat
VAVVQRSGGAVLGIGKVLALVILVTGLAFLLPSVPASGQELSGPERAALQHQKDALFQQMLRNPANLDVTFAYANVAAKLGDYEGAVSALDRMLLFNPKLARVQLELGALYFKMGAYDLALDYFQRAATYNPPPEVKARIAEYLGLIKKAQSHSQYSGSIFTGIQYQSDATLGPAAAAIIAPTSFGPFLIPLSKQFRKNPDVDIFGIGSLLYNYDLGLQSRDSIEATALSVVNHYFHFDRLDLDLGEVTLGPRLNFPHGIIGSRPASAKPYVIVNEVGLGENQYFYTVGVGGEYHQPILRDLDFKGIFEFRHREFSNAPDRPTSTGLDGDDKLVSLQFSKSITANSVVNLQLDYLNEATRFANYANNTYSVSASYSARYNAPFKLTDFPWQSTLFLARSWAIYDAPDPCCFVGGSGPGGSATRDDRHWRFGLTQAVVFSPRTALVLQLQRDIVSSNLPLYGYSSDTVVVGPQFRF